MDQIGLASKAWKMVCCLRYKRKSQGQPIKIEPSKSRDLTWLLGGRASVAIISPGDLIIRILGFDLLS